jgi:predicted TIM-barrel fold metal-dependent hydrolase
VTAFVDAHVHPPVPALLDGPLAPYVEGLEQATGRPLHSMLPEAIVEYYRSRNARAVLVGWDLETAGNRRPFSSSDVAEIVALAPDILDGYGAVDPAKGALAVGQVHEAARLGMKGIAVHPASQGMGPADRLASTVWEAAGDHGLVCLVHTGMTRLGYGRPGGSGVKLAAGNPMHVDAVAARFPHLQIILVHTGPLWQEEALAVATHKTNVSVCPTGAVPATWPQLLEAAEGSLGERIVFGSGFPVGDPDLLVKSWREAPIAESVADRILVDNALALFG